MNSDIRHIQLRQQINKTDILARIEDVNGNIVENAQKVNVQNICNRLDKNWSRWTTILTRMDGSVYFKRSWSEYKAGFGNPPFGEFFIGMEKLHPLTTTKAVVELLIILRTWDGEERCAIYDGFEIGNETEKYRIKFLGKYDGNAGDQMRTHIGYNFSTYDEDNDAYDEGNCAKAWRGAWWFNACYESHLFGPYMQEVNASTRGVSWNNPDWKGSYYSFEYAAMLLRPKINN
ncbi:ryncolin-1-like [Musca autumnalis]|uniref:ryncolin-1-like n=1 Tax=Musca autumnalis TaxID=221902 RepID=UPI003CFB49B8